MGFPERPLLWLGQNYELQKLKTNWAMLLLTHFSFALFYFTIFDKQ